ncbi:MAG: hypothetical protein ACXVCY_04365 [Pseudobdellovibrionaceae bacterium]
MKQQKIEEVKTKPFFFMYNADEEEVMLFSNQQYFLDEIKDNLSCVCGVLDLPEEKFWGIVEQSEKYEYEQLLAEYTEELAKYGEEGVLLEKPILKTLSELKEETVCVPLTQHYFMVSYPGYIEQYVTRRGVASDGNTNEA